MPVTSSTCLRVCIFCQEGIVRRIWQKEAAQQFSIMCLRVVLSAFCMLLARNSFPSTCCISRSIHDESVDACAFPPCCQRSSEIVIDFRRHTAP